MFTVQRVAAPVRTQVEDFLRSMIAEGLLKPGDRISERELCDRMSVSRPLMREALRLLEAEGLLQAASSGGLVVRTLTLEEADEVYGVRAMLEGEAAARFARSGSAAAHARLAATVKGIATALAAADALDMRRAKNAFYECLMDDCGNATLADMLRVIHGRVQLLRTVTLSNPDRMVAAAREIADIHAAVAAGDAEAARRLTALHIDNAAASIRAAWPGGGQRPAEPADQINES